MNSPLPYNNVVTIKEGSEVLAAKEANGKKADLLLKISYKYAEYCRVFRLSARALLPVTSFSLSQNFAP